MILKIESSGADERNPEKSARWRYFDGLSEVSVGNPLQNPALHREPSGCKDEEWEKYSNARQAFWDQFPLAYPNPTHAMVNVCTHRTMYREVSARDSKGNYRKYVFSDKAYLLNDSGKTVEVLSVPDSPMYLEDRYKQE